MPNKHRYIRLKNDRYVRKTGDEDPQSSTVLFAAHKWATTHGLGTAVLNTNNDKTEIAECIKQNSPSNIRDKNVDTVGRNDKQRPAKLINPKFISNIYKKNINSNYKLELANYMKGKDIECKDRVDGNNKVMSTSSSKKIHTPSPNRKEITKRANVSDCSNKLKAAKFVNQTSISSVSDKSIESISSRDSYANLTSLTVDDNVAPTSNICQGSGSDTLINNIGSNSSSDEKAIHVYYVHISKGVSIASLDEKNLYPNGICNKRSVIPRKIPRQRKIPKISRKGITEHGEET